MKKLSFIIATLFFISLLANAKDFNYPTPDYVVELWPDGAPTDNGLTGEEIDYGDHVSNVTKPILSIFLPDQPNGMAILACPGGGYVDVWNGGEGYSLADWYNQNGIVYAVLKYRLPNGHHEIPLQDVHKAMEILKSRANEFGFKLLGIQGCSAGGHLAATASTLYSNAEQRPDFQILFYPVISSDLSISHKGSVHRLLGENPSPVLINRYSADKQVTSDTPPAFIMANSDDTVVPVINSIKYYNALSDKGVKSALHVYPEGGHGWFSRESFAYKEQWQSDLMKWLERIRESSKK